MPICLGDAEDLTSGCHISRGLLGISQGWCVQEGARWWKALRYVMVTMATLWQGDLQGKGFVSWCFRRVWIWERDSSRITFVFYKDTSSKFWGITDLRWFPFRISKRKIMCFPFPLPFPEFIMLGSYCIDRFTIEILFSNKIFGLIQKVLSVKVPFIWDLDIVNNPFYNPRIYLEENDLITKDLNSMVWHKKLTNFEKNID